MRVAALVVAEPAKLVNTARTSQPFAKGIAIPLKLGEVKVVSDHVDPLSKESCHCTVGVGVPLAAAEKVTVWPEGTVWLMGCVVIVGATGGVTLSVAGLVVADPDPLVNTVSYSLPFSAVVVTGMVKVSLVAPDTSEKVTPWSVETCHCTVGVGKPLAAALKLALWVAVTV
jgi:hypothetical protein